MKMKKEHFEYLKREIQKSGHGKEVWEKYKALGLSELRYRWDVLYAAKLSSWICDNLYSYLNDDHIDTALRKILKEDYSNV
jgi:hypothetical protein